FGQTKGRGDAPCGGKRNDAPGDGGFVRRGMKMILRGRAVLSSSDARSRLRRPPPAARAVIGIRAGFRKREEADGCSNGCDRAEREEGCTVACLDDDQPSQRRR